METVFIVRVALDCLEEFLQAGVRVGVAVRDEDVVVVVYNVRQITLESDGE